MTDTKHTPGPWQYEPLDRFYRDVHMRAKSKGRDMQCHVFGGKYEDGDDVLIAHFVGPLCEENAKLATAAPDLLAACEAALDAMPHPDCDCSVGHGCTAACRARHQLRAAILKAKGN